MKQSTLIGLSILSVFLLCSLSYQPIIADDSNESYNSDKPIAFIIAKGNFTIDNENINGIIEKGIIYADLFYGKALFTIRNLKLRNFHLNYFYEGNILPIINKNLFIGYLNNVDNIEVFQPNVNIYFVFAKGNFTYNGNSIDGIADTMIIWTPMFYGWLPIKFYNHNLDFLNKNDFKEGLILPIFTRSYIIGFMDIG